MIKLEHVVLASPEQMEFIIEGMRNPMNSWEKSDSDICRRGDVDCSDNCYYKDKPSACPANIDDEDQYIIGPNDNSLMQRLANAGTDHRKFMRMMPVYVRITAPLYWWKEFDTYKVGTVANSCSTMHKIQEKEFTMDDFSTDQLLSPYGNHNDERDIPFVMTDDEHEFSPLGIIECCVIPMLNECRNLYLACEKALKSDVTYGINPEEQRKKIKEKQKQYWWQMIQLLPSSYNQTRNVMMNYEVLANIYKSRKNHKLDEWREFCKWIEELPYSELIFGDGALMTPNETRKKFGLEPVEEPSESLKIYEVGKAAVDGIQEGLKNINQDKDSYCLSPDQIATMNKAIKDRDDFDGFLSGK